MVSAKSNIGRPISDLHVHIVDKNRQPVALGLPGELVVAGRGVTDGYLKRPDLSAEKFVDNPFVRDQNDVIKAQYGKLYHSGDLARFMPNGDIEYLGRIDLQVKIRGHRIELGEIEAQLAALDEVREAVVLVREDTLANAPSAADKRLVGYLLAPPGQDMDISTVKQKLAVKLPDYMIPAAFVLLNEWPLTPNGKVDKKALPAPDGSAESSVEYVAPRNDTEAAIALMWTELLGCQDPGVYDNFFDLGGHSLIAVRMVREIETRFEVALPITELFNAQTIAGMAALVERQHAPWSPIVPINAPLPGAKKAPLFLIHPVGGMVLCYQRLADAIGKEQPIYGIQASGFAAEQTPFNSMEAMAAYYLEHIKTVQPEGPYYLGGQSLGGLIAFEVVRQLRARGDEVKLLVMMDSHRPSRLVRFGMNSDARFVQFFLNDIVGGLKLPVALLKGMDRDQLVTKVTEHTQHLFSAELLHNMFGVIEGFRDILLSYKPGVIDVPIQLIRPQDELKGPLAMVQRLVKRDFSGKLGWHKHTSAPLTTTTVSGSHYSILQEPDVNELAAVVRDILQQAQRETS
jgi:thioesterase domain-containing protein